MQSISDLFLSIQVRNELLKDYEKLLVPYVLELEREIDNVTVVTKAIDDFYFSGDIRTFLEKNITQVSDTVSFTRLLPILTWTRWTFSHF